MDDEVEATVESDGGTRRLWTLALIALGALMVLHLTPLRSSLEDVLALKLLLDGYGWKAHAAFGIGSIVVIAIGVPRLPLCGLAGVLFGFIEGMAVAIVSGLIGSYGAFLLVRWGGRQWAERKLSRASDNLRKALADPSIASIFIVRQLPVPGIVPNVLLGLLPTSHRTFLLGTFLGYLPSTAIIALAGSSLGKENLALAIAQVSLSMAGLAAFSALLVWLRRRFRTWA